jgi:NADH:ubiquinone oxidoreductase subunit H
MARPASWASTCPQGPDHSRIARQYAGTVNAVDRGPSTVGTLDIGLLRHAADEVRSVANHPAVEPRTTRVLLQIAGHLVELADILALEAP